MEVLNGKKILIGVSGSITAYKIPVLIRMLIKEKAEVKVITTDFAKNIVTPLTLATVSKNPVYSSCFNPETGQWHSHVELASWCDLFLIAPASANTLAKMAHGIADNLLLTTYLAAKTPVMIAPAMDVDMYNHSATQNNIAILSARKNHIVLDTESGELASGLTGKGRMPEPGTILQHIKNFFQKKNSPLGKTFIVTAGPTYEKIDSVRFIGNFSSGKMGYAIAESLANRGAKVILVSGPVSIEPPTNENITLIKVTSAIEMKEAVFKHFYNSNGAIFAAAVADYRPQKFHPGKIKRETQNTLTLSLEKNPDIAAEAGKIKSHGQITVGFALETSDLIKNAQNKLNSKNLDFIILNSPNDKGAGFGTDTNKITIIDKDNNTVKFELKPKKEVAEDIIDYLEKFIVK